MQQGFFINLSNITFLGVGVFKNPVFFAGNIFKYNYPLLLKVSADIFNFSPCRVPLKLRGLFQFLGLFF